MPPMTGAMEMKFRGLSTAMDHMPASVIITNLKGDIEYVNPMFTEVTGYSSQEVLGLNPRFLKSGESPPEFYQQFWASLLLGQSWRGEFHNKKKNGAHFWEQASISPIRDQQGVVTGYVAVKEDITARKLAEQKLQELQAELLQAQKMESLGSLAGGIAHDFNNILTAILGAAEMLNLKLEATSPARRALEIIFQAGRRARELNRQILTFSRKGREEWIPFDLSVVVKEATRLLHATLPKRVKLTGEAATALWVMGDPNQIHQVFMNLAINAFHAMGSEGGTLSINLGEVEGPLVLEGSHSPLPAGRFAVLSIRDTGCGMTRDIQERIFEPFYTTKDVREGTGLGLAVVHGIVHKHLGGIAVTSSVGKGSEFRVYLPISEARPTTLDLEVSPAERGSARVLLVDDEDLIAALLKQGLGELGYEVTAKTSSRDALAAFLSDPTAYDVLVTDLEMPHLSGAELTEHIQKIRPGLPTILVTGVIEDLTPAVLKSYKFDEILSKPQSARDISGCIQRVLEARRTLLLKAEAATRLPNEPMQHSLDPQGKILLVEDDQATRLKIRSSLEASGYVVQEAADGEEAWKLYLSAPAPTSYRLIMTDILMPKMDGLELVSRIRQVNPKAPVMVISALEDPASLRTDLTLELGQFLSKNLDPKSLCDVVNVFLADK